MRSNKTNHRPLRGILLALAVMSAPVFAQTALTTIQDTLFKADGTKFSGTVAIRWNTFDAANLGTVVQQSRSLQVKNGNLQVQLAPNAGAMAPANTYTVQYQSDGREQFTETWTVPAAAKALRVAEVRTGMLTSSSGTAGNQTPIVEAGVVGLVSDLAQRPVKGPLFGAGSVAFINQDGQIETVAGNIGDCVMVDGTAGPCGSSQPQFFDGETPGGLVDGTNLTFTLANAPMPGSLLLFRNGLYMKGGFDYALSDSTIQFVGGAQPQPLDTLAASYRVDPNAGSVGAIQQGGGTSLPRVSSLAQVICSSAGRETSSGSFANLGACDIPASSMRTGDRFEVRFDFGHTGSVSGFDAQVKWGSATVLSRHGSAQDTAFTGRVDATTGASGTQLNVQSWGTVLPFLPGIVSAAAQAGVVVEFSGSLATPGSDRLQLVNYTVLRYPGH